MSYAHQPQPSQFLPPMPTVSRVQIKRLFLIETGTYNPQYRRGYATEVTGHAINMLDERIHGAKHFTPSLLAGVASQIVRPQATPESANPIAIPHGWSERRLRFMMEVESFFPTSGSITEFVTGYTENFEGIAGSGAVDPNLMFFINSITHIRNTVMRTPTGTQNVSNVSETSQILVDNNWGGINQPSHIARMRPTDVYSAVQRADVDLGGNVRDIRTTVTSQAVKSSRSNNMANSYVADMLEGVKNAYVKVNAFGQDTQDMLTEARGHAKDPLLSKDTFLRAISTIRNQPPGNMFRYADLVMLDPNVSSPNVKVVIFSGPTQQVGTHYAGQSEGWHGSDRLTATAAILSQSVPAVLAGLAITKCAFQATNRNFGLNVMGSVPTRVDVLGIRGFGNGDLRQAGTVFEQMLVSEILNDISYNNEVDYYIKMEVDLLGETRITLSMDGSAPVEFVTPSFCDALMAPVLTENTLQAKILADDFGQLFDHVTSGMNDHGQQFGRL